jgi:hypothetical protein
MSEPTTFHAALDEIEEALIATKTLATLESPGAAMNWLHETAPSTHGLLRELFDAKDRLTGHSGYRTSFFQRAWMEPIDSLLRGVSLLRSCREGPGGYDDPWLALRAACRRGQPQLPNVYGEVRD